MPAHEVMVQSLPHQTFLGDVQFLEFDSQRQKIAVGFIAPMPSGA